MASSSDFAGWSVLSRVLTTAVIAVVASTQTMADDMVVLRNNTAKLSIALGGGGIVEFRFIESDVNPLNWEISTNLEQRPKDKPYLRGHFLCLDRWGAPSAAELKNGVPFHGEAPRVVWNVLKHPEQRSPKHYAEMSCDLKLAGFQVKRTIRLDGSEAIFSVTEEVTNINQLGRIYNIVQHPSIAPPFLDETTLVDSNAEYGFVQDGPIPKSSNSAARWPKTEIQNRTVDLRQFKNSTADTNRSDVSSFMFNQSDEFGWVTACNPRSRLLIGYIWKTQDYPWLNIWRYLHKGRVAARGLEFGTTGYHQPFEKLVHQGRILKRPLYEFIDAGQTVKKSYVGFLARIPVDFEGVAKANYANRRLTLFERRNENPRLITLTVGSQPGG